MAFRVFFGHPAQQAAAPFTPADTALDVARKPQVFTDIVPNLLLTLLAAAPAAPFTPVDAAPIDQIREVQSFESGTNIALLEAVEEFHAAGVTFTAYERKPEYEHAVLQNRIILVPLADVYIPGGLLPAQAPERQPDQDADSVPTPYALITQAPAAAPFVPPDQQDVTRRADQVSDAQPSQLLLAPVSTPFAAVETAQDPARPADVDGEIGRSLNVPWLPILPVDAEQPYERRADYHVEADPAAYALRAILAAPFPQVDAPSEIQRKKDQVVEQVSAPYEEAGVLEAPFRPVDTTDAPTRKPDPQADVAASLDVPWTPFTPIEYGQQPERPADQAVEQAPAAYAMAAILEAPFAAIDTAQPAPRRITVQPEPDQTPYTLFAVVEEATPFAPIDFAQPERPRQDQVEQAGTDLPERLQNVTLRGTVVVVQPGRQTMAQQPEQTPSWAIYYGGGEAPFASIDLVGQPEPLPVEHIGDVPSTLALITRPVVPVETVDVIERLRDQVVEQVSAPYEEAGQLAAPFAPVEDGQEPERRPDQVVEPVAAPYEEAGALEAPFRPVDTTDAPELKPDTQDFYYASLDLPWAPLIQVEDGQEPERPREQAADTQPAPYALYGILAAPFPAAEPVNPTPRADQVVEQMPVAIALTTAPIIPLYPIDWTPDPVRRPDQTVEYQRNTLFVEFQPPPYLPVDTTSMPERRPEYATDTAVSIPQEQAPFVPALFEQVERDRNVVVDEVVALTPETVEPFRPVDAAEGAPRRISIAIPDVTNVLLPSTVAPFATLEQPTVARRTTQQVDDVPSLVLTLYGPAPFVAVDVEQPYERRVPRQTDGDHPSYVLYGIPAGVVTHVDCRFWLADPVGLVWTADPVGLSWTADSCPVQWAGDQIAVIWLADPVLTIWLADPIVTSWTADPTPESCET
jgi:hypothetical protein